MKGGEKEDLCNRLVGLLESHEDNMQQGGRIKAAVNEQMSMNKLKPHTPSWGAAPHCRRVSSSFTCRYFSLREERCAQCLLKRHRQGVSWISLSLVKVPLIVSESARRNVVKPVGGCRLREEGIPAPHI